MIDQPNWKGRYLEMVQASVVRAHVIVDQQDLHLVGKQLALWKKKIRIPRYLCVTNVNWIRVRPWQITSTLFFNASCTIKANIKQYDKMPNTYLIMLKFQLRPYYIRNKNFRTCEKTNNLLVIRNWFNIWIIQPQVADSGGKMRPNVALDSRPLKTKKKSSLKYCRC